MRYRFILGALSILIFFGACAKEVEEYNQPAIYWYENMIKAISNGRLEKADSYFSSLQGEHIGSPVLKEATLIIFMAHIKYEEYILSQYFLDEYTKRYSSLQDSEFLEFLKIKFKYMSLPNPRRDQVLMFETIKDCKRFMNRYPNSMHYYLVDSMLTRLYMGEASLNETIAELYDRIDKPKGADYYRNIKPQTWIDWKSTSRMHTPWYRHIFEGDGSASWYGAVIPETISVVSRNTVKEEELKEESD